MKESVITVNFDVESEAYQALSEIKRHPDGSGYFVSAASLIKKENGHIVLKDGFDTGVDTADDAAYGSLIGSLVGILGGPLGVLFGGSMGALVGSTVDADDAVQSASLIEQVCTDIRDGGTALIALVQEDDDMRFGARLILSRWKSSGMTLRRSPRKLKKRRPLSAKWQRKRGQSSGRKRRRNGTLW